MIYRDAIDVPARYQWDNDSRLPAPDPGTASGNCGVTCVAMMAQYITGTWSGIYATRRLAVSNNKQTFTSIGEQQTMLRKRGVACHMERLTIPQITARLATRRWPIMVGLDMSEVPDAIRGHPFTGSHAILLRANVVRGGVPGKLVADPNFSTRTGRTDPTNGRRFYPDWVLQVAYYNSGKWALVPDKPKAAAPVPKPMEEELDATRYIPITICDVASGGTVYADPDRKRVLISNWPGQKGVGLYARAAKPAGALVPIRIEVKRTLRVGYVGADKVSNIR